MNFHRRLAARGYYVSSAHHPISAIVPGPSQNRACAIYAHGSSSVHSPCSEQIHHNSRLRQGIFFQELRKLLPGHTSPFPSAVQPFEEQFPDLVVESSDSLRVVCHPVVGKMPPQLRGSRFHQFRGRQCAALLQPFLECKHFGLELLPRGFALHSEPPTVPRSAAKMRQPQKVERLGLLTSGLCFQFSQWTELQDLGFLGRNFKAEIAKPSIQFRPKPHRIVFALKANHKVVTIADQTRPAFTTLDEQPCKPQIKSIMKIDVGKHWRNIPPCGEPSSVALTTPSSSIPAIRNRFT